MAEVESPTGLLIRPRKDNGSSLDCDWAFRHTRTDNDRAQQVLPHQHSDQIWMFNIAFEQEARRCSAASNPALAYHTVRDNCLSTAKSSVLSANLFPTLWTCVPLVFLSLGGNRPVSVPERPGVDEATGRFRKRTSSQEPLIESKMEAR